MIRVEKNKMATDYQGIETRFAWPGEEDAGEMNNEGGLWEKLNQIKRIIARLRSDWLFFDNEVWSFGLIDEMSAKNRRWLRRLPVTRRHLKDYKLPRTMIGASSSPPECSVIDTSSSAPKPSVIDTRLFREYSIISARCSASMADNAMAGIQMFEQFTEYLEQLNIR